VITNKWTLKELVNFDLAELSQDLTAPAQLSTFQSSQVDSDAKAVWLIAGFEKHSGIDYHMLSWFMRSIERKIIKSRTTLFVTPLANPFCLLNAKDLDPQKIDANNKQVLDNLARWKKTIDPSLIIHLSSGKQSFHHIPDRMPSASINKISELSERSAEVFDEELAYDFQNKSLSWSFASQILNSDCAWLEFSTDPEQKELQKLKDHEWKNCIGPALKWCCETDIFTQKSVEESLPSASHEVIGVMDLPKEFANL